MIVFDVIQIVSRDHVGSASPGEHWIESHDSRETAERLAESYNQHASVPTIRYVVEEIDERDPARKMPDGF